MKHRAHGVNTDGSKYLILYGATHLKKNDVSRREND